MFTANLVFSTHYEPFFFHPGTCATEIALAVESNKKINDLIEEIFATELANWISEASSAITKVLHSS